MVTNAVYFKGKWQYPFPWFGTSTQNFTALSKDSPTKTKHVQVQMMGQTFSAANEKNVSLSQVPGKYTAVRLPYKGSEGLAAVFVLPDESYSSIGDFAGSVTGATVLDPVAWGPLPAEKLSLKMPKFKIEARLGLTQVSNSCQSHCLQQSTNLIPSLGEG